MAFSARSHGRDHDLLVGLFRIAADSLFGWAGLEDAEVAEFHAAPGCERFGDGIEGVLDDGENLLLNEAGFFGDRNDEVALGQVGHGVVAGHNERLGNVNRHRSLHPPCTRSRDGFPRGLRTRLGAV